MIRLRTMVENYIEGKPRASGDDPFGNYQMYSRGQ